MGQVPVSYLIIGDGRVARHFRRYFEFEAIPFSIWSRKTGDLAQLQAAANACTHVLLLISDRAIAEFHAQHGFLTERVCVHFSGALTLPNVIGMHPLMTFTERLYTHEEYRAIPFVIERGCPPLPRLSNLVFEMDREQKGLYHALCVLSGNFTVLLWEKTMRDFAQKLALPKEALVPYMQMITENLALAAPSESVLTGPLQRGDQATIDRHLQALGDDPYADVYRAFVDAFRNERVSS